MFLYGSHPRQCAVSPSTAPLFSRNASPICRTRAFRDRRHPRCPIDGLAAEKPNALAVAPDDDPVSVMLDFVHPISA
jgi:hypothetical protein